MRGLLTALPLLLIACGDKEALDTSILIDDDDDDTVGTNECPGDADCDGYPDEQDCDPDDPYVNPGMSEIPYDGRDNDCGGDGDLIDVDQDGYVGSGAIDPETGEPGTDCNDGNPNANPGATEQCYNEIDEDCDGIAQGDLNSEECANDCDCDGYVDRGDKADDCNAFDETINPGADEIWYDGVDQDCDEESDYDADRDGENAAEYGGTDCDDEDDSVNSLTTELWDGLDNNCNTILDDVDTADAVQAIEASLSSGEGRYGFSVASAGDLTGDGSPELLAGAPDTDAVSAGAAYITTLSAGDGVPSSIALSTIAGDNSSDEMGWDLTGAGDLTGDGLPEVIVGAPGAGLAYVFSGADLDDGGTFGPTDATVTISGDGDRFGVDVAYIGDIDRDGKAEVAIGSGAYADEAELWLGIWSGADLGGSTDLSDGDAEVIIYGDGVGGEAVGGADFDGDGLPDLVVSGNVDATPTIVLLSGNDISLGGEFSIDDLPQLTGPSGVRGGAHSGILLDADGDGYSELVFSAPDADSADEVAAAGVVYIVDGDDATSSEGSLVSIADVTIYGEETGGSLVSLDAGGDFDGDGQSDLVVSDVGDIGTAAVVSTSYVFYGADLAAGTYTTADRGASFRSGDSSDYSGYAGVAADFNGDGDDDLAIGAPQADVDAGAVYVYESLLVK